jgi:hypothetical protein
MATRKQDFVVFYSPGTFVDESSEQPVESWDIKTACKLARKVSERHGSKPYGFRFETRIVADPVSDGAGGTLEVRPKTVKSSGLHYIDGTLRTLDEVQVAEPESALAFNMRVNNFPIVCDTANSWKHTGIYDEKALIVSGSGEVLDRGNDPKHVAYRKSKETTP